MGSFGGRVGGTTELIIQMESSISPNKSSENERKKYPGRRIVPILLAMQKIVNFKLDPEIKVSAVIGDINSKLHSGRYQRQIISLLQ